MDDRFHDLRVGLLLLRIGFGILMLIEAWPSVSNPYVGSLKENLEMFSPDGRIPIAGLRTIAEVLSTFDKPLMANPSRVNPSAAFTNEFVDQAHKVLKH